MTEKQQMSFEEAKEKIEVETYLIGVSFEKLPPPQQRRLLNVTIARRELGKLAEVQKIFEGESAQVVYDAICKKADKEL